MSVVQFPNAVAVDTREEAGRVVIVFSAFGYSQPVRTC